MAAVLPILAMQSLGLPPATYGLIASTTSLAALLGSMLVTAVGARATLKLASLSSLGAQLLGFGVLAVSWSTPSLFVAVAILGLSTGVWNVVSSTTLMKIVPAEVRGRVMAAYRSIAFAGSPTGNVIGGATGEGWLRVPLYAAAFAAAVSLAVFARDPRERVTHQEA
jgi:MFS family permease